MKIEEQILSIEQMKRLQDLGIDTSDASMVYMTNSDNPEDDDWTIGISNECLERHNRIPAYTIEDLIDKLPPEIKFSGMMMFARTESDSHTHWTVMISDSKLDVFDFDGSTLKNALYNLLCWAENHKELIK